MIQINSFPEKDLTAAINSSSVHDGDLACWWLGQAGFALKTASTCCIIDPYLSNSLALKYRDAEFTHQRMIPIPVDPLKLKAVNAVLCTHQHSDHMDPGTLPTLLEGNPGARLVAPKASLLHLSKMGQEARLSDPVNPQMELSIGDFKITVLPAAHETMGYDEEGNCLFLGYVIEAAGVRLYHSGDCVPFKEQAELLGSLKIDMALLPVNGRDEYRANRGVPGNFTATETAELCREVNIPKLLVHHFNMFSFNTAEPRQIVKDITAVLPEKALLLPEIGIKYILSK